MINRFAAVFCGQSYNCVRYRYTQTRVNYHLPKISKRADCHLKKGLCLDFILSLLEPHVHLSWPLSQSCSTFISSGSSCPIFLCALKLPEFIAGTERKEKCPIPFHKYKMHFTHHKANIKACLNNSKSFLLHGH